MSFKRNAFFCLIAFLVTDFSTELRSTAMAQEYDGFGAELPDSLARNPLRARRTKRTKNHRIAGQLIGNYAGAGLGLSYEHRVSSYFHLIGQFAYTQADLKGELAPEVDEKIAFEQIRLGFGAKLIFKYRFYLSSLLNVATYKGDYGYRDNNSDVGDTFIPFEGQGMHLNLNFGNEWLLVKGLFVGVDWVGVSLPISTSVEADSTPEDDLVTKFASSKTVAERILGEIEEQVKFHYLTFHFGIRF